MQVLVVGGEHAFVQGTFANKLQSVGVTIGAHWDWTIRRPPQVLPKGCKGVVVLHDMVGHHLSDAAREAASSAGVPFALVPRKFSAALPVLQKSGIVIGASGHQPDADDPDVDTGDGVSDAAGKTQKPDTDMRTWISLVLEANFTAGDGDVADKASEFVPGVARDTLIVEVSRVRDAMRSAWASKNRSAEAERTLRATTQAWLAQSPHDPDDPLALARIRAEAHTVFGVPVPEDVLIGAGFHAWEIRGMISRERVRKGVRDGDTIIAGMTPAEFDAFRDWVINVRDNGKANASQCPITVSLKGLPSEGITVILRAVPDIGASATARVYHQMTGASLGPYYHTAVVWAAAQVPNPASKFDPIVRAAPPVEVTAPPVEVTAPPVEEGSLLVRLINALFSGKSVPEGTDIVAVATDARAALDAVNAAAAAVADGGDTSAVNALVNGKAADIIARRDLEHIEEKRRQAEAAMRTAEEAFRRAQEEYILAQGVAEEARSRITRLRTGQ